MIRPLLLLVCGYSLLVLQMVLPVEATGASTHEPVATGGAIAWLLLPWLAAVPNRRTGLMTAGIFGIAFDCIGGLHPGLLLGLTVCFTAVLQNLPWPALMQSCVRIAAMCFACSLVPAVAVCTVLMAMHPGTLDPQTTISSLVLTSATGSVLLTALVCCCRAVSGHPLSLSGSSP